MRYILALLLVLCFAGALAANCDDIPMMMLVGVLGAVGGLLLMWVRR
mgnify:CR=1 FL=1